LVSTISIYDMTMQAQRLVSETYLVFEIWFTVAGIYLLINLMLSMLVKFVNMKVYE
ncbi:MAG TPA: polar amino acid ABC transporter permease, partial [Flexistipes sinusarabici]|nr:polar amino acid ABC transporter permease [Flexistipes sinusarabici]